MRKISVAIFGFLAMTCGALADDGPSYEETVKFIKEKHNIETGGGSYTRFIEIERCKFRNKIVGGDGSYHVIDAIFSDLDPELISSNISHNGIGLVAAKIRSGRPKIFFKDFDIHGKRNIKYESTRGAEFLLNTLNPEINVPKLSKALSHLIKLCGGKSELF